MSIRDKDNKDYHHERSRRPYSPQYRSASIHRDPEISEAQTSVDYHLVRNQKAYDFKKQHSSHNYQKSHHREDYDRSERDYSRDSYKKEYKVSRSFENSHHSSRSKIEGKIIPVRQYPRSGSFAQKEKTRNNDTEVRMATQRQNQREKQRIMDKIQRLDYNNLDYENLHNKFIEYCGEHMKFRSNFPESSDRIGTLLLKDGLFHEMWSFVILKNPLTQESVFTNSYYYSLFRPMIQLNLTSFEKVFNPIPEQQPGDKLESTSSFKRDRQTFEQNTRSTTKTNIMMLYEQVKEQIKNQDLQSKMIKKIEDSVSEYKIRIEQNFPPIEDPYNIEWFDSAKAIQKINAQEEHQIREAEIEKIRKQKQRQKSPFSNRFRMMHQIQSNQRRMAVEIACVFFNLTSTYHFSDIHIVKLDELIFSQNQEIIVLKAYSMDFCPLMGKMKLEPKLKNLIAVYKFCNLTELSRLAQTHGQFHGIIVYPQCFNVQKYLTTSNELSLLKSECLEQIKEQIRQQMPEKIHEQKTEQSFQY